MVNIEKQVQKFEKRNGRKPKAWELPIHDRCACNKCEIAINHPDYDRFEIKEGDPVKKCVLPKSTRQAIGKYFNLKNEGLTKRELAGKRAWKKLPQKEKKKRIAKLKKNSPITRLNKKGYAITRKKKDNSNLHKGKGSKTRETTSKNDLGVKK